MTFEIELIIRLIGAAICGGILGIEREHRQKSAGIRTHVIVAIASAIMMIVSKYGFFDVIDQMTADESDKGFDMLKDTHKRDVKAAKSDFFSDFGRSAPKDTSEY